MEFKKVTLSLPTKLYEESMRLVKLGLFSNISDIVRSGIRLELKGLEHVQKGFTGEAEKRKIIGDLKQLREKYINLFKHKR